MFKPRGCRVDMVLDFGQQFPEVVHDLCKSYVALGPKGKSALTPGPPETEDPVIMLPFYFGRANWNRSVVRT